MTKTPFYTREAAKQILATLEALAPHWNLPTDSLVDIANRLAAKENVKWFVGTGTFASWEVEVALAEAVNGGEIRHLLLHAPVVGAPGSEQVSGVCGSGLSPEEFAKLPPETRLGWANKQQHAQATAMKEADRLARDRIAGASLPPDFDTWTPERRSQYADKLNERHNASKWERRAAARKARNA